MSNNGEFLEARFVPIERKFLLTVDEAAEYCNIGTKKIRELIQDPRCEFVIHNGSKCLIKRNRFEEFLNSKLFI